MTVKSLIALLVLVLGLISWVGASPSSAATSWTAVSAGESHTCGKVGGKLYCWGDNEFGQLGDGTTTDRSVPTRVGTQVDWLRAVSSGGRHTCAIRGLNGGALYCWGDNQLGQLGDGTTTDRLVPTRIGTLSDWKSVSAGFLHTCAVRGTSGGALYCWGSNGVGQIGDGTFTDRAVPTRIGTLADWKSVDAGSRHNCALRGKTGGALYCWGYNSAGQVGDGTVANRPTPKRVGTLTDWKTAAGGGAYSCAIRGTSGGALYCWGTNGFGNLGDGTTSERLSPKHIGTLTDWQSVSVNSVHSCAIRAVDGGTLYCWGYGQQGALGDGTTTYIRSTPKHIGTLTKWKAVTAGERHTCAIRGTSRVLSCWGGNEEGQLGDGTTIQRTTPKQINVS